MIPGAIWLDPGGLDGERPERRLISDAEATRLRSRSEVQRAAVLGTIVPARGGRGGLLLGEGDAPDSAAPGEADWAVVASDPYEQGGKGTVAWSITSAAASGLPRRVELLADGQRRPARAKERPAPACAARWPRGPRRLRGGAGAAARAAIQDRAAPPGGARRRRLGGRADGTHGAPLSREDRDRLLAAVRAGAAAVGAALAALVGLSFAAAAALATFR